MYMILLRNIGFLLGSSSDFYIPVTQISIRIMQVRVRFWTYICPSYNKQLGFNYSQILWNFSL